MHVSDDGLGLREDLAIDGRQQTEHSVGRGVLRAHVKDHLLGLDGTGGNLLV